MVISQVNTAAGIEIRTIAVNHESHCEKIVIPREENEKASYQLADDRRL